RREVDVHPRGLGGAPEGRRLPVHDAAPAPGRGPRRHGPQLRGCRHPGIDRRRSRRRGARAPVPEASRPHAPAPAHRRRRSPRRRRRSGARREGDSERAEEVRRGAVPKAALAGLQQNRYAARGAAGRRDRRSAAKTALARAELSHLSARRRRLPRTQHVRDEILGNPQGTMSEARRFVVKVGSTLVTNRGAGLDASAIARWAGQVAKLKQAGKELVLVSSGAIAEGMQRLGWTRRPNSMHELQAAAAVVQVYESCFRQHGLRTAQVLLTHADLADRQRYLNARSTLRTLLELGIIPVINENDTVVTEEIRFGDNDTLAALVTNLVEADCLI